ncbi:hypothetical protein SAMN05421827_13118 [Pedobacter terrae]|uniref:Uncharacterized protein n=1 Tax=Pedobacter terrae TaxID=405671 RepID=A0A1G8DRR9_9SPHI|nr:hypothetical protein SAMN05421827_13118 [Pedobacter terrae]
MQFEFFYCSMPQGHGTLERQSTQSALSIQQGGFTLAQAHQKNSGTLFCVQTIHNIKPSFMNTKPLRSRFVSAFLFCRAPVFLILLPLGIDGVLR